MLPPAKAHAIRVRAAQHSGGVAVPSLWWATDDWEDLEDGSYLTGGVERGERLLEAIVERLASQAVALLARS